MSTTVLWTEENPARRTHDADMRDDTIFPSELRRPDLLLHQVSERLPFDRPRTLLARVEGPYEQQRLVDCTVLWDEPAADEHERTLRTEEAMKRLGFGFTGRRYPQWPIVVPVVVRPGSAWWSWDEREVWLGLRYGYNLCDVLQSDVLTVTSRGWISQLDELHGVEPRAAWAALPATEVLS